MTIFQGVHGMDLVFELGGIRGGGVKFDSKKMTILIQFSNLGLNYTKLTLI